MPRAKRRIARSWVKIVMNIPPRVNGRRAVAPRNDQDLARPVLLPVPPQRSLARHEHIISRQLTKSAPSRTRDLASPQRWCVGLVAVRLCPADIPRWRSCCRENCIGNYPSLFLQRIYSENSPQNCGVTPARRIRCRPFGSSLHISISWSNRRHVRIIRTMEHEVGNFRVAVISIGSRAHNRSSTTNLLWLPRVQRLVYLEPSNVDSGARQRSDGVDPIREN
jgi:hypothetical protein